MAALSLTQVAQAGPPEPAVPSQIEVCDGNKVFLVGHGVGVQIYSCKATSSGFSWGFVAPRANLYADNGELIITHFGGPTWQAKDGSKVVGGLAVGVTVDPTAIPGCGYRLFRRPLALTATGSWPRPSSNGSQPPAPHPARRGMQPDNGRDSGRGPIHRRLLLLEEDGCLTQRRRPEGPARGANRNPQR